ncbi:Glutamate--cysteine ligase EgtA [Streptomyces hirsutus]
MSDSANGCIEPRPAVTEAEVEALVRGICFKTGPPRRLGVEVEWLVHELRAPQLPVTSERLEAAYAALRTVPLNSALTVEPGGQLELSSQPAASLMECVGTVRADLDAVRAVLREDGLGLVGFGHDPWHTPRRFLREPRYDAMEACLDRTGPAGRAMMCTSASVQVCLDAGYEEPGTLGHVRRWWLAHHWARCWWPRSPTPRWPGTGPPAGCPPGSCAGLRSAPAARAAPCWTPIRAAPGPGTSWTRR